MVLSLLVPPLITTSAVILFNKYGRPLIRIKAETQDIPNCADVARLSRKKLLVAKNRPAEY